MTSVVRNTFFSAFLLLFILPTSVVAMDLQEGVRGVRWGLGVSSVDGMNVLGQDDHVTTAWRSGEELSVNGLPVDEVTYAFYDDQFLFCVCVFNDAAFYAIFHNTFSAKYGTPAKETENGYLWQVDKVDIELEYAKDQRIYRINYYYNPLFEKFDKE